MGLSICSFASGSGGNCIFVSSGTTKILVDIGISVKRVETALSEISESTENLSVLVTHSHSDHIKYVSAFSEKYNLPVYAHRKTIPAIKSRRTDRRQMDNDYIDELPLFRELAAKKNSRSNENESDKTNKLIPFDGGDFFVGDITVSPFRVSHDIHCMGYSFYHQGKKLTIATDLGILGDELIDHIKDSDAVLLESNHDLELITANNNYSPWLKRRILSDKGHLSNTACAAAAKKLAACRTKNIILGHLSEENNYPELAFSEVCSYLSRSGIREGHDVLIDVAPAEQKSRLIKVV